MRSKKISNCGKKNGYPTIQAARKSGDKQTRKNPNLYLFVYKCDICESYHLTKRLPNKQDRFIYQEAEHWEKKLNRKDKQK